MIQHCKFCDRIIKGNEPQDFDTCPYCHATQKLNLPAPPIEKPDRIDEDEIDRLKAESREWRRLYEEAMRLLEVKGTAKSPKKESIGK